MVQLGGNQEICHKTKKLINILIDHFPNEDFQHQWKQNGEANIASEHNMVKKSQLAEGRPCGDQGVEPGSIEKVVVMKIH